MMDVACTNAMAAAQKSMDGDGISGLDRVGDRRGKVRRRFHLRTVAQNKAVDLTAR